MQASFPIPIPGLSRSHTFKLTGSKIVYAARKVVPVLAGCVISRGGEKADGGLPREDNVVEEEDLCEVVVVAQAEGRVGRLQWLESLVTGVGEEADTLSGHAVRPPPLLVLMHDAVPDADLVER